MFHGGLNDKENQGYTALYDLNLLGLWYVAGSEWTLTIKEECLAVTNQHFKHVKSTTRSITLLSALVAIALLGAATLTTQRSARQFDATPTPVCSSRGTRPRNWLLNEGDGAQGGLLKSGNPRTQLAPEEAPAATLKSKLKIQ